MSADDDLDDLDDEEFDEDFDDDIEEPDGLRAAVAAHIGGNEADVFIDLAPAQVPGLTVFAAHLNRRSIAGVWDGSSMNLDPDRAIQAVTDAWGYDASRPVPPRQVAAAIGMIEGKPGAPFLDDNSIRLADVGGDVAPPAEVEVEGSPGVRFWNSTSRMSPYPVTYVVVDGSARIHRG
jgi:hypothetical protein